MSSVFRDVFAKQLGKSLKDSFDRSNSQMAQIEAALSGKSLDLKGTIAIRADEYLDEKTLLIASISSEEYLNKVAAEFAERTVEKMIQEKFTKKEKGGFKIKAYGLLRDRAGKIISPLKLSILLQSVLHKYVKELMGSEGRLNNQTGRLAHSGKITNITQIRNSKKVSFMFTYQRAPYEVFEPGNSMGSEARSPKALFTQAIRNALEDLLNRKRSVAVEDRIIRMVKR